MFGKVEVGVKPYSQVSYEFDWVDGPEFPSVDVVIVHPLQVEDDHPLEPRIQRLPSASSDSIPTSIHAILTHFDSYHFSFLSIF